MYCRMYGCEGKPSRYGKYCTAHKARDRRHGDPAQETITETSLKPYRSAIRARIRRNPSNPLWSLLETSWREAVGEAEAYFADARAAGKRVFRFQMSASQEVAKLAQYVEPREVVETALAMFLLQDQEPRRFKSDKAFRVQLSRRIRALTDVNVGTYINPKTGKPTRVYRELTPRVAEEVGRMAAAVFGGAGVMLAELERKQAQDTRQRRAEMADAIAGLV